MIVLTGTVTMVVVVACLYWAQAIFIPLALAIFLTFLLSPLVSGLQRRGLGRAPSVVLVVAITAVALGGIGWFAGRQVVGLIDEIPQYSDNIKGKVKSLRQLVHRPGAARFERMVHDISGELSATPPSPNPSPKATREQPPPTLSSDAPDRPVVVVQPDSPPWLSRLPTALGSVVESLGVLALALVLLIFMLLKREDLRNRLIRLVGHGRVTLTTKAVDDVGQRISRFLLMQAIVNGTYGLALTVGLLLIGVEYAFLWGFLAGILRYIPYLGAWVAALPIVILSLAEFEGWLQPVLVVGLILVIELVSNNVMEPRLYGQSMGVSEVALLVSAAFWGFLWGPIGMVLSSPLTVCLVVLGKYVPQLKFLEVLLGDEPPLEPRVNYYQRLLARDQDEATQLALAQVRIGPPEQLYDALLVPALNYAKRDRQRDDLTDADEAFILRVTREILDDFGVREALATAEADAAASQEPPSRPTPRVPVLAYPASDQFDHAGLEMLRQLLDPGKWDVEIVGVETLTAELLELVEEKKPSLVCIGSLPPGGLARTRYLCKRLRARFPKLKIFVGHWGLQSNFDRDTEQLREAGADEVTHTLLDTRTEFSAWLPVLAQEGTKTHPEPAASGRLAVAGN
jgi:predicted PurR-regulated permease PerM